MKIATWNINSMNVRQPHVFEWLQVHDPDVLVLQEIKQPTEKFPVNDLRELGYHAIANGQKTYNGVAVVSKQVPADPVLELPDFEDPQRRVLGCSFGDMRVINLYVPNGSEVGSEKYTYKLEWLSSLRRFLQAELQQHEDVVVLGDFNIAPADADVYDPEKWGDAILCSPQEREALNSILELGFSDVFRKFEQPEGMFSWWDYRAAGFRRNAGLRIDLILTSASMAQRCTASYIDKEPRAWERPSDHAPVIAVFDG
ncbi:MAG: exodeoxyribonuclease III [Gammaproteobacteria bacterium]|nr:exodeoxyribonuclease III [Gammaproteobacteria bacterium]